MINETLLRTKIDAIQTDLARLAEYAELSFDEGAKDWKTYSVVKLLLMEIIGRAIDCNQHIIAENASVEVAAPLDYRETFLKLAELNVLPAGFAETIAKSAGFRNAIVHGYNNLDKQLVFITIGEAIRQYTNYCGHILTYIKKQ